MAGQRMGHDELAHDLAECRRACREIVGERLGLGQWGGHAQIDVAAMKPSWTNPNPAAYEVKVSRSDFLRDTQAGKYRKYLPYVRRLYFAAPSGLLSKDEIPEGCGLIVRGENDWRVVKAPRPHNPESEKFRTLLMALVLKDHPAPWASRMSRAERIAAAERTAADSLHMRGIALSNQVHERIRRAQAAVDRLEYARRDVALALGEPAGERTLEELVREVLDRRPPRLCRDLDGARDAVRRALSSMQVAERALERALSEREGGA